MSFRFDTREWKQAMREFSAESKKDSIESINRSMQSILYRAPYALLKRTFSQTKPGIQQDINSKYPLLVKLAAISLSRKGIPQTKQKLATEARRIMAAKYKSAGYIVSGWVPAARAFGANKVRKTSKGGKIGESFGTKATTQNKEAIATNAVASLLKSERIYKLVDRQMMAAVKAETADLIKRTNAMLEKTAKNKSGGLG